MYFGLRASGCKSTGVSSALKMHPPQPSPGSLQTGWLLAVTYVYWKQEADVGMEWVRDYGSVLWPFGGRTWQLGCSLCPCCGANLSTTCMSINALYFTLILSLSQPKRADHRPAGGEEGGKIGVACHKQFLFLWSKPGRVRHQSDRGWCVRHLVFSALSANRLSAFFPAFAFEDKNTPCIFSS